MTDAPHPSDAAHVRPFSREDLPAVARLFLRVFRHDNREPSAALIGIFETCFLKTENPVFSKVYVEPSGEVTGFVGALAQDFVVQDRIVTAIVVGSLMVRDPHENPLAGARLLRALSECGKDVVVSETANLISQKMWEKMGGQVIGGYSLDFFKIIQPFGFLNALACYRLPFFRFFQPLMTLPDYFAARLFRSKDRPAAHFSEKNLSVEEVAEAMVALEKTYSLYPDFDVSRWRERMQQAVVKEKYGTCISRGVFDRRGTCVGLYVLHAQRGRTAQMLQILAHPSHMREVALRMFAAAEQVGAVAVRGRSVPPVQQALAVQRALFIHRSSLILYTKDKAVQDAFAKGEALTTGLAGETWVGLIGGTF